MDCVSCRVPTVSVTPEDRTGSEAGAVGLSDVSVWWVALPALGCEYEEVA